MIPSLIPLSEATITAWQRKVRDALNGTLMRLMSQGATSERPLNPASGTMHYDTSLKKPVWWSGDDWRDASGAIA